MLQKSHPFNSAEITIWDPKYSKKEENDKPKETGAECSKSDWLFHDENIAAYNRPAKYPSCAWAPRVPPKKPQKGNLITDGWGKLKFLAQPTR